MINFSNKKIMKKPSFKDQSQIEKEMWKIFYNHLNLKNKKN